MSNDQPYSDRGLGVPPVDPASPSGETSASAHLVPPYGEAPASAQPEPWYPEPGYTPPTYAQPTSPSGEIPAYAQPAYAQPAYAPPAYAQPGYPQPGYAQPGYPQQAYGPPGHHQSAYPAASYPATAYPATAYAPPGYGLPHNLAGWGLRVGASLIDSIVPMFLLLPTMVYALATQVPTIDRYGYPTTTPTTAGVLALLFGWLATFAFSLWNRAFRQGRTGQSIGKQAMRLQLVKEHTLAPTGAGLAFLRDLAHQLDGAAYIGYLWPLWDAKRQTFADKICTTYVITV